MSPQRKTEAISSKAASNKSNSKRGYKTPAIRKDQKLGKVTGGLKVTGQPQ
jgi:hypothetical protein